MSSAGSLRTGIPSTEVPGRAPLRGRPFLALLVPLVLVNAAAVYGQAGWALQHLAGGLVVALLFAAAVESIGIYLSLEAHDALMNDQAAGLLRLGSYAIGALAGALNFWHFAGPGYTPTATAVTFGLLSSISPWLWAIRSRSLNRGRLAELGMIDKRGVKLSTSRKFWHPVRSVKVIRWASWEGITNPDEAVRRWELTRDRPEAPVSPAGPRPEVIRTAEEWAALAHAVKAETGETWELVGQRIGRSARRLQEDRKRLAR